MVIHTSSSISDRPLFFLWNLFPLTRTHQFKHNGVKKQNIQRGIQGSQWVTYLALSLAFLDSLRKAEYSPL